MTHVIVALGKVEIVVGLDVELRFASLERFCHGLIASSVKHCGLAADSYREPKRIKMSLSSMISITN